VNCVWDNHSIRTRFGASNVPLSLGLRGVFAQGVLKTNWFNSLFHSCELRIANCELRVASHDFHSVYAYVPTDWKTDRHASQFQQSSEMEFITSLRDYRA